MIGRMTLETVLIPIFQKYSGRLEIGTGGVCTEHLAERRTAIENMATEGNDRI